MAGGAAEGKPQRIWQEAPGSPSESGPWAGRRVGSAGVPRGGGWGWAGVLRSGDRAGLPAGGWGRGGKGKGRGWEVVGEGVGQGCVPEVPGWRGASQVGARGGLEGTSRWDGIGDTERAGAGDSGEESGVGVAAWIGEGAGGGRDADGTRAEGEGPGWGRTRWGRGRERVPSRSRDRPRFLPPAER